MPELDDKNRAREMERIHGDTAFFIEEITKGYGFFGDFIESMRAGDATVSIRRRTIHKIIEEQWLNSIEMCLPAIDIVTRNYSVGIEEREEVLPIQLSKNINNRSIRHLAQHTDFIEKVEGDTITPSKILNVIHEETMQTYENRFVNTLIQRLYTFVDRRYSELQKRGTEESGVALDFDGAFQFGTTNGKIRFHIDVSDPAGGDAGDDSFARMKRVREAIVRLLDSSFVRSMQDSYIRPPVMRTNAIMKNKYLRQCLDLWDYIESYEKVGYIIDVQEKSEKPDEAFLTELYSLLSMQYMIFDYSIHGAFGGLPEVLTSQKSDEPLAPHIVTRLQKVEVEEYNVYDTEYRRVVNVSALTGQRRLSDSEMQIRNAVEAALAAEREIENLRRKEKRKEKRASGKQKTAQETES